VKNDKVLLILMVLFVGCNTYDPQNGDIIFQTSRSNQSKAIQAATKSPYSHMGIVYLNADDAYVFEASKTVKLTPLADWINRGIDGKYVVKRLLNADTLLTKGNMTKLMAVGERFKGKPYDRYFEWSDERIYCSELVWKMYDEAVGIQIGELQKLKEFDLAPKEVSALLR
jgi:hypothetical protein